ncbi:MAG TPA: YdhR family protein [Thermomicrobiales bacterium]|nr:YdhR family protein [Thermomicrobiales bacterium]
MHAVLITVRTSVAPDALTVLFAEQVEAVQSAPGLVMKTWLRDGDTLAGFHLFATRETADEYLAGGLAAEFSALPARSDHVVRHFAVLDELSHATGTPRPLGA